MNSDVIISPSILSADFSKLLEECESVLETESGWLHFDIMDGHFVPNITIGVPIVKSMRKHSSAFFDCHFMISNPEKYVEDFAKAGSDLFTFHIESTNDPAELCRKIRGSGMKCGVSVKPNTNVETIFDIVDKNLVDLVLVMTVEPGFGGQKFMEDMMSKVVALRKRRPELLIEVDGGISTDTIISASKAGANVFVVGSALFRQQDRIAYVRELKSKIQSEG